MKKIPLLKEKKTWLTLIVILAVLAILGAITANALNKGKKSDSSKPGKTISMDEAKTKAEDFINKYLMQPGTKATVKDISTEYGLYKLSVDITTDVVESYISKDGRLFFPQALNVEEINGNNAQADNQTANAAEKVASVTKKSDKPTVELFVMSYCPYGTQIEKGMLPVIETLGDKIDFKIKFCSYAMHGEKELDENLVQYCIQEEQPAKLASYLKCFLADGKSDECLDTAKVNKSKISSCVSRTDKKFKVTANYEAKAGFQGSYPGFEVNKADNDKYGVAGSPTLIINGQEVQSGRDSSSLLKTICGAFNNAPEECNTTLSSASPSAGFGFNTDTTGGSAADCGQ